MVQNQYSVNKYKYDFFYFVYYILFYLLSGQNTETIVQIILLGVTKTEKKNFWNNIVLSWFSWEQ